MSFPSVARPLRIASLGVVFLVMAVAGCSSSGGAGGGGAAALTPAAKGRFKPVPPAKSSPKKLTTRPAARGR